MKLLAALCLSGLSITGMAQSTSMSWNHEPKAWAEHGNVLTETVEPNTDYWRVTHYGFIRDSGPFRYQTQSGDFEASVHITGKYRDSSGLSCKERLDGRDPVPEADEAADCSRP
jgi:hypothetical protein